MAEDEGGGAVVAVRRVNELDFYSLGATQLAKKVGLTPPKCHAVIRHIGLRDDVECFKEISIGRMKHRRYSPRAIERIQEAVRTETVDEICGRLSGAVAGGQRRRRIRKICRKSLVPALPPKDTYEAASPIDC